MSLCPWCRLQVGNGFRLATAFTLAYAADIDIWKNSGSSFPDFLSLHHA
jgi:hypothetical protein